MEVKETKRLNAVFENKKAFNIIFIIGILLILLIFFSDVIFPDNDEKSVQTVMQNSTSTIEQMEKKLEEKLLNVLKKVEGIGETSIMVTLESAEEYVFVDEAKQKNSQNDAYSDGTMSASQNSSEYENSYIMVEGVSGRKEALVKTIIQPKVRGVIVHCENGGSHI